MYWLLWLYTLITKSLFAQVFIKGFSLATLIKWESIQFHFSLTELQEKAETLSVWWEHGTGNWDDGWIACVPSILVTFWEHKHCYSSERCVPSHSPWPKLDCTLLAVLTWCYSSFLSYFCQDYTIANRKGEICFQTKIIDFVGSGMLTI